MIFRQSDDHNSRFAQCRVSRHGKSCSRQFCPIPYSGVQLNMATPVVNDRAHDEEVDEPSANALSLTWSFGFNKDIVGGVHSLVTDTREAYFYVSAHTGVIYDYVQRTQLLLQGHCNPISCCVVSEDKRWIVTADAGSDSMLVVWDAFTGNPIQTLASPHEGGVSALDISPDALFIATLSAMGEHRSSTQELSIWEWATASDVPLFRSEIETEDVQHSVRFNTYNIRELVTNGRQRVIFWNWASSDGLAFYSPPLLQRDFRQTIRAFTQSCFVPNATQAVTATEDGDIILWDIVASSNTQMSESERELNPSKGDRRATKLIRVSGVEPQVPVAIHFLSEVDGYLVVGCADGAVRFYDFEFHLIAWFEDVNAGAITSISFASRSSSSSNPEAPSSTSNQFHVPDFIVGTSEALIVALEASAFHALEPRARGGTVMLQGMKNAISDLSAHPQREMLALVSEHSGAIQLWNYASQRLLNVKTFTSIALYPDACAYSPDGRVLAVGFTTGILKILDAQTLEERRSFQVMDGHLVHLCFSGNGSFLAASDEANHVGLWRYTGGGSGDEEVDADRAQDWTYLGRIQAHAESISGLAFHEDVLVSVSIDRTSVVYDLTHSSVQSGIQVTSALRIEQHAHPTACFVTNSSLWIANDAYKLKRWKDGRCRQTVIGPTLGGPVESILPLASSPVAVYATKDRVVGLLALPVSGHPEGVMGLIAHPGSISSIGVSCDESLVFTAGGSTVNMWQLDVEAFDQQRQEAANNSQGMLDLLEGGPRGPERDQIEDYFVYTQLRSQGEDSTLSRDTGSKTIKISNMPDLMRALGYYPTEEEIGQMCNEVRYRNVKGDEEEGGVELELMDDVGFHDFVELYLNYRPVQTLAKSEIEHAFAVLLESKSTSTTFEWQDMQTLLCSGEEAFSREELSMCLQALIPADEALPQTVDASVFSEKILGFEEYPEEEEEAQC